MWEVLAVAPAVYALGGDLEGHGEGTTYLVDFCLSLGAGVIAQLPEAIQVHRLDHFPMHGQICNKLKVAKSHTSERG